MSFNKTLPKRNASFAFNSVDVEDVQLASAQGRSMVTQLPLDVARSIKEEFAAMCAPGHVELSFQELMGCGIPGLKVDKKTFMRIDKDGSGLISFEEFLAALYPRVQARAIASVSRRLEHPTTAGDMTPTGAQATITFIRDGESSVSFIPNELYAKMFEAWHAIPCGCAVSGELTLSELEAAESPTIGGIKLTSEVFHAILGPAAAPSDALTLNALLKYHFPAVSTPNVDRFEVQFLTPAIFLPLKAQYQALTADKLDRKVESLLKPSHLERTDYHFCDYIIDAKWFSAAFSEEDGSKEPVLPFEKLLVFLFPAVSPALIDLAVAKAVPAGFFESALLHLMSSKGVKVGTATAGDVVQSFTAMDYLNMSADSSIRFEPVLDVPKAIAAAGDTEALKPKEEDSDHHHHHSSRETDAISNFMYSLFSGLFDTSFSGLVSVCAAGSALLMSVAPDDIQAAFQAVTLEVLKAHAASHQHHEHADERAATDAAAQRIVITRLSHEDVKAMYADFKRADLDIEGALTYPQVQTLSGTLTGLSISETEFQRIDADGSGRLDFCELLLGIFPSVMPRHVEAHWTKLQALSSLPAPPSAQDFATAAGRRKVTYLRNSDFSVVVSDLLSLDKNGDGELGFDELGGGEGTVAGVLVTRDLFDLMDEDMLGTTTIEKFISVLFPRVPPADIQRYFALCLSKPNFLKHHAAFKAMCSANSNMASFSTLVNDYRSTVCGVFVDPGELREAAAAEQKVEAAKLTSFSLNSLLQVLYPQIPSFLRSQYCESDPRPGDLAVLRRAWKMLAGDGSMSLEVYMNAPSKLSIKYRISQQINETPIALVERQRRFEKQLTLLIRPDGGTFSFLEFLIGIYHLVPESELVNRLAESDEGSGSFSLDDVQDTTNEGAILQWAAVHGRNMVTAFESSDDVSELLNAFLSLAIPSGATLSGRISAPASPSASRANLALPGSPSRANLAHAMSRSNLTEPWSWSSMFPDGPPELTYDQLSSSTLMVMKLDRKTFNEMDVDKNGFISFGELMKSLFPLIPEPILESSCRRALRKAFGTASSTRLDLNIARKDDFIANEDYFQLKNEWIRLTGNENSALTLADVTRMSASLAGTKLTPETFAQFDRDGSGYLEFSEVIDAIYSRVSMPDRERFVLPVLTRSQFHKFQALFQKLATRLNTNTTDSLNLTGQHLQDAKGRFDEYIVPALRKSQKAKLTFEELLVDLFPNIRSDLLAMYCRLNVSDDEIRKFVQTLLISYPPAVSGTFNVSDWLKIKPDGIVKIRLQPNADEKEEELAKRQANFDFSLFGRMDTGKRGVITILDVLRTYYLGVPQNIVNSQWASIVDEELTAVEQKGIQRNDSNTGLLRHRSMRLTDAQLERSLITKLDFEDVVGMYADFNVADVEGYGSLTYEQTCTLSGSLGGLTLTLEDFSKIDRDKNSRVDFVEVLQSLFPSVLPRNLEALWNRLRSGAKEYEPSAEDFADKEARHKITYLSNSNFNACEAEFRSFDEDGNGELDFEELGGGNGEIAGIKITAEVFEQMDGDGSGAVDVFEFLKVMFPRIHELDLDRFRESILTKPLFEKVRSSMMRMSGRPHEISVELLYAASFRIGGYYVDPEALESFLGEGATERGSGAVVPLEVLLKTLFPSCPPVTIERACLTELTEEFGMLLAQSFEELMVKVHQHSGTWGSDEPPDPDEGKIRRSTWLDLTSVRNPLKIRPTPLDGEKKKNYKNRLSNYLFTVFQNVVGDEAQGNNSGSTSCNSFSFLQYMHFFFHSLHSSTIEKFCADPEAYFKAPDKSEEEERLKKEEREMAAKKADEERRRREEEEKKRQASLAEAHALAEKERIAADEEAEKTRAAALEEERRRVALLEKKQLEESARLAALEMERANHAEEVRILKEQLALAERRSEIEAEQRRDAEAKSAVLKKSQSRRTLGVITATTQTDVDLGSTATRSFECNNCGSIFFSLWRRDVHQKVCNSANTVVAPQPDALPDIPKNASASVHMQYSADADDPAVGAGDQLPKSYYRVDRGYISRPVTPAMRGSAVTLGVAHGRSADVTLGVAHGRSADDARYGSMLPSTMSMDYRPGTAPSRRPGTSFTRTTTASYLQPRGMSESSLNPTRSRIFDSSLAALSRGLELAGAITQSYPTPPTPLTYTNARSVAAQSPLNFNQPFIAPSITPLMYGQ